MQLPPRTFKPRIGSGDSGFTQLFGGKRVPKTDLRVAAGALLDDLNSLLGAVRAGARGKEKKELAGMQRHLITAAGGIAGAKSGGPLRKHIAEISALTALRAGAVRAPKGFILAGRDRQDSLLHLARTRARLCELLAWRLKARLPAVYLNRLSDYLFLLAIKK